MARGSSNMEIPSGKLGDYMCIPKDQGGLGILDLELMNKAMLRKWLWNLENTDGLWQNILKSKYLNHKTLSQTKFRASDTFLAWADGNQRFLLSTLLKESREWRKNSFLGG